MRRTKRDRYVIVDWTGKRCWPRKYFDHFEDAWAYIYSKFQHLDDDAADAEFGEYEVILQSELRG